MVDHPKPGYKTQIPNRMSQQLQLLTPHDSNKLLKLDHDISSSELFKKINTECERSDRLTVVKLDNVNKLNKENYKSKLVTEKYSLLPINPQQLTPAQTALQRLSEKHLDFEIHPVNTIRPPDIEFKRGPQSLELIDTPL